MNTLPAFLLSCLRVLLNDMGLYVKNSAFVLHWINDELCQEGGTIIENPSGRGMGGHPIRDVRQYNKLVLALDKAHSQLKTQPVRIIWGDLPRLEGLDDRVHNHVPVDGLATLALSGWLWSFCLAVFRFLCWTGLSAGRTGPWGLSLLPWAVFGAAPHSYLKEDHCK